MSIEGKGLVTWGHPKFSRSVTIFWRLRCNKFWKGCLEMAQAMGLTCGLRHHRARKIHRLHQGVRHERDLPTLRRVRLFWHQLLAN